MPEHGGQLEPDGLLLVPDGLLLEPDGLQLEPDGILLDETHLGRMRDLMLIGGLEKHI